MSTCSLLNDPHFYLLQGADSDTAALVAAAVLPAFIWLQLQLLIIGYHVGTSRTRKRGSAAAATASTAATSNQTSTGSVECPPKHTVPVSPARSPLFAAAQSTSPGAQLLIPISAQAAKAGKGDAGHKGTTDRDSRGGAVDQAAGSGSTSEILGSAPLAGGACVADMRAQLVQLQQENGQLRQTLQAQHQRQLSDVEQQLWQCRQQLGSSSAAAGGFSSADASAGGSHMCPDDLIVSPAGAPAAPLREWGSCAGNGDRLVPGLPITHLSAASCMHMHGGQVDLEPYSAPAITGSETRVAPVMPGQGSGAGCGTNYGSRERGIVAGSGPEVLAHFGIEPVAGGPAFNATDHTGEGCVPATAGTNQPQDVASHAYSCGPLPKQPSTAGVAAGTPVGNALAVVLRLRSKAAAQLAMLESLNHRGHLTVGPSASSENLTGGSLASSPRGAPPLSGLTPAPAMIVHPVEHAVHARMQQEAGYMMETGSDAAGVAGAGGSAAHALQLHRCATCSVAYAFPTALGPVAAAFVQRA